MTLNICNGQGKNVTLACECLARHNINIAVLMETKMTNFWPSAATGYSIVVKKAPLLHCRGVMMAFRTGAQG